MKNTISILLYTMIFLCSCSSQPNSAEHWKVRWQEDTAKLADDLMATHNTIRDLTFEKTVAKQASTRLRGDLEAAHKQISTLEDKIQELEQRLAKSQKGE